MSVWPDSDLMQLFVLTQLLQLLVLPTSSEVGIWNAILWLPVLVDTHSLIWFGSSRIPMVNDVSPVQVEIISVFTGKKSPHTCPFNVRIWIFSQTDWEGSQNTSLVALTEQRAPQHATENQAQSLHQTALCWLKLKVTISLVCVCWQKSVRNRWGYHKEARVWRNEAFATRGSINGGYPDVLILRNVRS